MLWKTLHTRIGNQQMAFAGRNHVYALLRNPKTHEMDKVCLQLKYDRCGHPYLIADEKRQDRYENTDRLPHRRKRKPNREKRKSNDRNMAPVRHTER